jgi:hypothetical protein
MGELLLIELVMCAAVIVVTAAVMVMHWRRGSDQHRMPAGQRRGALAELADAWVFERDAADVPGSSHDTKERDLGTSVPADLEQAAESPASGAADPEPGSPGLGTEPDEPPAAAGAVTIGEWIGGYYEQADQPLADYLAAARPGSGCRWGSCVRGSRCGAGDGAQAAGSLT